MAKPQLKTIVIRHRFWLYSFVYFLLIVGLGEVFCRVIAQNYNPLTFSGFGSATRQFQQIKTYIRKYGAPECILIGSSLVETDIDPNTFSKAFELSSGKGLDCYNFGMDASTMSSTVPMAMILSKLYKPSYVIIGIQAFSFEPHKGIDYLSEDRFQNDSWVRYSLGNFNLAGWIVDKSALYSTLRNAAIWMFPEQSVPPTPVKITIHPGIPRTYHDSGYAPLLGYLDTSPIYQSNNMQTDMADHSIDANDFAALERVIDFAQKGNLHLILVEIPIMNPPAYFKSINNKVETYTRQHGVPFLSTNGLPQLPATAYADNTHMQISGSMVFSQWLGMQLGKAVADGALSDVDSLIWSPVLATWPKPTYLATLGLSKMDYSEYVLSLSKFSLFPQDALVFNPDGVMIDRQYLQSLIGFEIDWRAGITSQDRENLFQFIAVLGKMRYLDGFQKLGIQDTRLERWRSTLDPSILHDLGINYILCRVELANPEIEHCPHGIAINSNFTLVRTWNFDSLYEEYFLYQVFGSN